MWRSNFDFFVKNGYNQLKRSRKRLKKTYEVKFCSMQKEISYICLKKRLPIKSLKIASPLFQQIFVKTKKLFLYKLPSNKTRISQTFSLI